MKKIATVSLIGIMAFLMSMGISLAKMGDIEKGFHFFSARNHFIAVGKTCINGSEFRANFRHAVMKRFLHCLSDLDLSDETKDQILSLFSDYKDAQEFQNQAMIEAVNAYWNVYTATPLDEAALEQAESRIESLHSEDLVLRRELLRSIRSLLTDEEIGQLSGCFDQNAAAE